MYYHTLSNSFLSSLYSNNHSFPFCNFQLPPLPPLGTADLQSAAVIFTHTDVYLSCVFTSGSAAQGCHFAFSLASSTHSQTFNVSRTDKEACFETYNQRLVWL